MRKYSLIITQVLIVIAFAYPSMSLSQTKNDCEGNGCGMIKITGSAKGIVVTNNGAQKVHVGVRWYFGGCQKINYFDINPKQSIPFASFKTYCPPYITKIIPSRVPPHPCSGIIRFNNPNGSGRTVWLYAIEVQNGSHQAPVFCKSVFKINSKEIPQGGNYDFKVSQITPGTTLLWNTYKSFQCDGNNVSAFGSIASMSFCDGVKVVAVNGPK